MGNHLVADEYELGRCIGMFTYETMSPDIVYCAQRGPDIVLVENPDIGMHDVYSETANEVLKYMSHCDITLTRDSARSIWSSSMSFIRAKVERSQCGPSPLRPMLKPWLQKQAVHGAMGRIGVFEDSACKYRDDFTSDEVRGDALKIDGSMIVANGIATDKLNRFSAPDISQYTGEEETISLPHDATSEDIDAARGGLGASDMEQIVNDCKKFGRDASEPLFHTDRISICEIIIEPHEMPSHRVMHEMTVAQCTAWHDDLLGAKTLACTKQLQRTSRELPMCPAHGPMSLESRVSGTWMCRELWWVCEECES